MASAACAVFSAIFGYAVICHLFILFAPWQLGYREGAVLLQVRGLLHGINVYSPEQLPLYLNVYGSIYNSVGWLFCKMMGGGFFPLRLISFLSILASLLLLNDILRRRRVLGDIRLALCLYMYFGLLFGSTPLAQPDALGFLSFILCFWLFEVFQIRLWSILMIIVLSLLGFLIKLYFVIAAPLVISYVFLFRSKKMGLVFTAIFLGALVSTYVLDTRLLPGYLSLILALTSGNATPLSLHSTIYMLKQTSEFTGMYLGAILLCLQYRKSSSDSWGERLRSLSFPCYASVVVLALLTFKLGHHGGAIITYYVQLLAPFMLVSIAPTDVGMRGHVPRFAALQLILVYLLTAVITVKAVHSPFRVMRMGRQMSASYQDVLPYHEVLGSPMLVSTLLDQQKSVYYSGQSEYFMGVADKKALLLPGLDPSPTDCSRIEAAFEERISNMIVTRQFDMIVTDGQEYIPDKQKELIRTHYQLERVRQIDNFTESEWVPMGG
jgi:hypothetical protein